jgi:predicted negative regulator of RcsB-dependent stress response
LNDYTTDEELSNKIKEWWAKNGLAVVMSATLAIGLFGGFTYWSSIKNQKAENLSINYSQLLVAFNENRLDDAESLAHAIIEFDKSSNYALLSKLILAKIKFESGNTSSAKNLLNQVIIEGKQIELDTIARERLARILLQESNAEDARLVLLNSNLKPADRSLELLGDIYQEQGDLKAAGKAYDEALTNYNNIGQDTRYLLLKINMLENIKAKDIK